MELENLSQVGAFVQKLKRSNAKIRNERAETIAEDVELILKRQIEDTQMEIRNLERRRLALMDLSPDNAQSLVPAKDFDAGEFVKEQITLLAKKVKAEEKYEICMKLYNELFGQPTDGGE